MAKTTYTPEEKKTLRRMFWNSGLTFSSFNMVKMEGNAFALTMEPALDELYKDKAEKAEAMRRHIRKNFNRSGLYQWIYHSRRWTD